MPGYTLQRRGTVRTLPNYWIVLFYELFVSIVLFYVLFVCKCVLYYCHQVSTQLQLNISYRIISYFCAVAESVHSVREEVFQSQEVANLFNSVTYVFLLLCLCILIVCMLCSVYSLPTGILQLPWLRFFHAFSSVIRYMPGYTSQRRGTVRTVPN